jgi:hypothetical protein
MLTRIRPALGAGLLITGLLLTGCSAGEESLPDINTAQERIADAESVVGYMTSADDEQVVLTMPDGSKRTFAVREEDANRIGVDHLASHAGFTSIGFEVFYETEDGTDYILGAQETNPPPAVPSASPAS